MNDSLKFNLDDNKYENSSEKEIASLKPITSPEGVGIITDESHPILASLVWRSNDSYVFEDSALAEMNAELEQFTSDAFCTPRSIVACHLLNELDGFRRYAQLTIWSTRF